MDLALTYSPALDAFDVSIDALNADLRREETFTTAVVLSLMIDRLAEPGDVAPGADRRGWWADAFAESGDRHGSRLWLMGREKQLDATVERAKLYIEEALQWLIDDGVATSVAATVFVPRRAWLVADVAITLDGASRRFRFEWSDDANVWRLAGELQ